MYFIERVIERAFRLRSRQAFFRSSPTIISYSCSCSGTALPSMLAAGSETRTWFAADGWSALHEQEQDQEQKRELR
jgi:hypothetical protein